MPELILIRGLSGSGKTELANLLMAAFMDGTAMHVEADMFFTRSDGAYTFDPGLLPEAHQWCQGMASGALRQGQSVIVSNTFSQEWELKPYLDMAKATQAKVRVLHVEARVDRVDDLANRNTHGVTPAILARMLHRWQHHV